MNRDHCGCPMPRRQGSSMPIQDPPMPRQGPPMPTSSVWRPSGNCLLNKVKPPASTSPNPHHLHRGHWLVSHCNALVHFVQSDQFNPVVPVVFFLSFIFFCFEQCHRHLFEIWDDNFLSDSITLYTNTKASLSEFRLIMSLYMSCINRKIFEWFIWQQSTPYSA